MCIHNLFKFTVNKMIQYKLPKTEIKKEKEKEDAEMRPTTDHSDRFIEIIAHRKPKLSSLLLKSIIISYLAGRDVSETAR